MGGRTLLQRLTIFIERLDALLLLAFAIPAVAERFTVGFAPICGFLRRTMGSANGAIAWLSMSVALSFALWVA